MRIGIKMAKAEIKDRQKQIQELQNRIKVYEKIMEDYKNDAV